MRNHIFSFVVAIFLLLTVTVPIAPSESNTLSIDTSEWYEVWTLDSDRDRIDDRLEDELHMNDYSGTYPLFIDYETMPTSDDIDLLTERGLEINYVAKYMPTIAVQGADHRDILDLVDLPGVVMVERDFPIYQVLDTSSSGVKARESGLYSPETAWDEGYTGKNIVIAILDTGVDDNHESLDGKFVAGIDVSNQGFDVNGNPDDGNGHGSHCAGIAMGTGGATDDNSDGEPDFMGTAPDAQLVDVKISTTPANLGNSIVRGIEWCRDNKDQYNIRILSISWGSQANSDGQDATSRAANDAVIHDGLIVVAAAGNDGPDNNGFGGPAAGDEVITVASVDNMNSIPRGDDEIADYSNRGPRADDGDEDAIDELKPEISAPGSNIMSVQYSEVGQGNPNLQGQYVEQSGTSMACPHISGIIACMLEANPNLTPQDVKDILKDTADTMGEPYDTDLDKDYSKEYGWGLVDSYKAVLGAKGEAPIEDEVDIEIQSPSDASTVSDTIDITGIVEIEGEPVIDSIDITVGGNEYQAEGTESWSYSWNSWDVENGNYTLTASVTANNGSLTDYESVAITVNNTGSEPDDDDSDELIDIEDLKELNEVTGSIIAVLAIIIVLAVILLVRKRKASEDENSDEDYDDEYDEPDESW